MITKSINKVIAGVCTLVVGTLLFSSCNDFLTIYPTDRTIGTDFWKTKADVEEMMDGAYKSMIEYGIQERAIVWGAYRSDELVKQSDLSNLTLDNISAVNLLPTNYYNKWEGFYKVINNCNIVLDNAPNVLLEDPEFTEGDYNTIRAQMLALRSLCYFYLVRAFRDVPYSASAYTYDDQVLILEQSTPEVVLQHCLDDLIEAERDIMKTGAYGKNNWRNWGYMTRDAVDALIADIYLWRASMTHNTGDYQQAISYIDKVVAAKDDYYNLYHIDLVNDKEEDKYHLEDGDMALYTIFNNTAGNSHESILEWQYNGRNNSNQALENYYYESGNADNHSTTPMLMASSLFNSVDKNADTDQGQKFYLSKNDYRYWNNVYDANNEEAQQMGVRKMIETSSKLYDNTDMSGAKQDNSRAFNEFHQNWIVYRLTDLMLMKAEALTEIAANDSDEVNLKQAFDLVQVVNKRSLMKTAKDTLLFTNYKSKSAMELLVLGERERELCFEGKRWFDLMRYCYRHMSGVNINQTLASTSSWPALYQPMLKMVVRKYANDGGGDAVSYKMKSEPYLYWPILESELKVNSLLKQNPVYIQEKSTSKN